MNKFKNERNLFHGKLDTQYRVRCKLKATVLWFYVISKAIYLIYLHNTQMNTRLKKA